MPDGPIGPNAELQIMFAPEVLDQMASDPKLAEMIRSVNASFHQAFHGVKTGKYKDFDEAVDKVTSGKVKKFGNIDPDTNEFTPEDDH